MKLNTLIFIVVALVIIGGVIFFLSKPVGPGQYDTFAQCLSDKGATFYGTWWCPHCRDQKALFGPSMKYITYIECAPQGNTNTQLPVCKNAKIEGYPTWEFADKTRVTGTMSLADLAAKTSCVLPSAPAGATASTS